MRLNLNIQVLQWVKEKLPAREKKENSDKKKRRGNNSSQIGSLLVPTTICREESGELSSGSPNPFWMTIKQRHHTHHPGVHSGGGVLGKPDTAGGGHRRNHKQGWRKNIAVTGNCILKEKSDHPSRGGVRWPWHLRIKN